LEFSMPGMILSVSLLLNTASMPAQAGTWDEDEEICLSQSPDSLWGEVQLMWARLTGGC